MIEIQRKDGSWIKFSCPEWNYYSAAKQAEIIRNLQNSAENIIPMPSKLDSMTDPILTAKLFDHTAN